MMKCVLLSLCLHVLVAAGEGNRISNAIRLATKQRLVAATPGEWTDAGQQTASNVSLFVPAPDTGDHAFMQLRALECPPGTYECASGGCCKTTQTCQPDGCCDIGETQCGAEGCYNPTTSTCCSATSTYCPLGYSCFAGGKCCPTGQSPCGTSGCYDPATSICCGGTGKYCPKGYDCVAGGGCCPTGTIPCGAKKCYDPETEVCCTEGAVAWACDLGKKCCAGGDVGGGCYNAATEKCCAQGLCGSSEICCGTRCCVAELATCGPDSKCTARTQSMTAKSTTAKPTATTTKMTRSCSTPTPTKAQTKTETIPFVYNPTRSIIAKEGPYKGHSIGASNEAIIRNMCDGINKYSKGKGGNSMTLTHGGKCFQRRNREIMCPRVGKNSWCKDGVAEYVSSFYSGGIPSWATAAIAAAGDMSCDEFPFASSVEGGDMVDGLRRCVPSEDQNFQGKSMLKYFNWRKPRIEAGHKYVVEIRGWDCDTMSPAGSKRSHPDLFVRKRDAFAGGGVSYTGPEMWRGFDPDDLNLKLMPMPLGDLAAGSYVVKLNMTGNITDIALIDHNGNDYNITTGADGTVSFTLDDDVDAIGLSGTTYDEDAGVVYHATALSGAAVTTTTGSPSTSPTATTGGGIPSATSKSAASRSTGCPPGLCLLTFLTLIAHIFV